jgi:recombination protein RecT
MSTPGEVTSALERSQLEPRQATIADLIERQKPAIERALPAAIGADRFARIVLTEVKRTPALLDCHPETLLASMMLAAQLGLEPGPLGHVYLVPFKRQVEFIIGYRGMIELASRSGRLKDIVARTVYDGDGFSYEYGLTDKLSHRPALPADRGEATHYYGVARFTSGGRLLHVAYPEDIEARRKRSPSARKGVGPWVDDYDAMARKTVVRMMSPYLPMTPTFGLAAAVEDGEATPAEAAGVGDVLPAPEGDDA